MITKIKKLFFPGSGNKIYQSKILTNFKKKKKIILLSVNIEIEKKIIKKIKNFINKNDKILSIYPDSPRFFLTKKNMLIKLKRIWQIQNAKNKNKVYIAITLLFFSSIFDLIGVASVLPFFAKSF